MLLRTLAACLAIALVPALAAAAPAPPPAAILKLTNAVIHGTNANDPSEFSGLFTADATVVDENAPFVWRGAGAAAQWWRVVQNVSQKMNMSHMQVTKPRISEFVQSANDAYLVQPLTIVGIAAGKPFAESGTLTYTFHQSGGAWLISTMVWTTKPG